MSLFSALKSIFSGSSVPEQPKFESFTPIEYEGYTIIPTPQEEGSQYRIYGQIVKGEQSHTFVRADLLPSAEACRDEMVRKARQMIDQQGDAIF
ncbi:HlyU family transcriptional regulator [Aliamphritea ceti]|uniref:HlyU family transcriptional regulator n=1 Tax=Aliamphritea ceti TaxID=1524258 RepID=UPI0021C33C29|nr:HlyU family transcriptional regulator [Aliamphritea ceti]